VFTRFGRQVHFNQQIHIAFKLTSTK
jgi:hypothetical protein